MLSKLFTTNRPTESKLLNDPDFQIQNIFYTIGNENHLTVNFYKIIEKGVFSRNTRKTVKKKFMVFSIKIP